MRDMFEEETPKQREDRLRQLKYARELVKAMSIGTQFTHADLCKKFDEDTKITLRPLYVSYTVMPQMVAQGYFHRETIRRKATSECGGSNVALFTRVTKGSVKKPVKLKKVKLVPGGCGSINRKPKRRKAAM